jgi:hypothetical protein
MFRLWVLCGQELPCDPSHLAEEWPPADKSLCADRRLEYSPGFILEQVERGGNTHGATCENKAPTDLDCFRTYPATHSLSRIHSPIPPETV